MSREQFKINIDFEQLKKTIKRIDQDESRAALISQLAQLEKDISFYHDAVEDPLFTHELLLKKLRQLFTKIDAIEQDFKALSLTENDQFIIEAIINNLRAKFSATLNATQNHEPQANFDQSINNSANINTSATILINAIRQKYQAEYGHIKRLLYEESIPIEKNFINLVIVEEHEQTAREQQQLSVRKDISREEWTHAIEDIYKPKQSIELSNLFTLNNNKKTTADRLLIEGRAGIGKSTFCQYIAYHWACDKTIKLGAWAKRFQAILWLPINYLEQKTKAFNIGQLIHAEYLTAEEQQRLTPEAINSILEQWESKQQVLYLFDGFDELADAAIDLFKNKLLPQKPCWIMTSRPHYIGHDLRSIEHRLEIIGFTEKNIQSYIEHYFQDKSSAVQLKKLLEDNRNFKNIAHVPILLELICSIWPTQETDLDKKLTLTDLYEKVIVHLLRRYLNKPPRQLDTKKLSDHEILNHPKCKTMVAFLQTLAWQTMQQKGLIINPITYEPLLQSFIQQNTNENSQFYQDVFQNIGLLKGIGKTHTSLLEQDYYFIHLTFQEFLAGRYLADCLNNNAAPKNYQDINQLIIGKKYEPKYEYVWWFMFGNISKYAPKKLTELYQIFSHVENNLNLINRFLLLIRCLEEGKIKIDDYYHSTFNLIQQILDKNSQIESSMRKKILTYLNMSPNWCAQVSLEDHLLQRAEKITTQMPPFIFQFFEEISHLTIKTINRIVTLIPQRPDLGTDGVTLLKILSNQLRFQGEKLSEDFGKTLFTMSNSSNLEFKKSAILLFPYLKIVSASHIEFLLNKLLNEDVGVQGAIITVLDYWRKEKNLTGQLKLRAINRLFKLVCEASGWLKSSAAETLYAMLEKEEHCAQFVEPFLQQAYAEITGPDFTLNQSQQSNQTRNAILKVSNILSSLIATEYETIKHYLLTYLKIKTPQHPKKIFLTCCVIATFNEANCFDNSIVEIATDLLEQADIPALLQQHLIDYLGKTSVDDASLLMLKTRLSTTNNLTIKLTIAKILLKNGYNDKVVITTFISSLESESMEIQQESIIALLDEKELDPRIVKRLIVLLNNEKNDFSMLFTTFKEFVFRILVKECRNKPEIERAILKRITEDLNQFPLYVHSLRQAHHLPLSFVPILLDRFLKTDTSLYSDEKRKSVTKENIRSLLSEYYPLFPIISEQIKNMLNKADASDTETWLILFSILAENGDLDTTQIQQSFNCVKKDPSFRYVFEIALNAYSKIRPKELIELISSELQSTSASSSDDNFFHHLLRTLDLSDYLDHLITFNPPLPRFVYICTPNKALFEAYFRQATNGKELLYVALKSLFDLGSPILIENNSLIWYEPQRMSIGSLTNEQLGKFYQDLQNIDLPIELHAAKNLLENYVISSDHSIFTKGDAAMPIRNEQPEAKSVPSISGADENLQNVVNNNNQVLVLGDHFLRFQQGTAQWILQLSDQQQLQQLVAHPEQYHLTANGLGHHILTAHCQNLSEDTLLQQLRSLEDVTAYLQETDKLFGHSALHWCAVANFPKVTQYLLDEGFEETISIKTHLTPVQTEILLGHTEAVIQRFNALPKLTETTIEIFNEQNQLACKFTLNDLHIILMKRDILLCRRLFTLLAEKNIPIHTDITGIGNILHFIVYLSLEETKNHPVAVTAYSLLQFVMQQRFIANTNMVNLLVQKNGHPEHCSPLMLAAQHGKADLVHLMTTHLLLHVDQANGLQEIERAFYLAAQHGQKAVVQAFLHLGFIPTANDLYNKTITQLDRLIRKANKRQQNAAHFKATKAVLERFLNQRQINQFNPSDPQTQAYENLVLQGGGGKGFAFPFALQAFQQYCQERSDKSINPTQRASLSFGHIKRVAGTSAGAIFAMGLALGYTPADLANRLDVDFSTFLESDQLDNLVKALNVPEPAMKTILEQLLKQLNLHLDTVQATYAHMQNNPSTLNTAWHFTRHAKALYDECKTAFEQLKQLNQHFQGFSSGRVAYHFLKQLLEDKGLPFHLTFGDLAKLVADHHPQFKHLHVVVTNLIQGKFEVLSSENPLYRDYIILDAVRASMSYPLVFVPHRLAIKAVDAQGNIDIHPLADEYVDGGVLRNYAIDEFDFKQYVHGDAIGDRRFPELNKKTLGFRFQVQEPGERKSLIQTETTCLSRLMAFISIYTEAESLISDYLDKEYHRSINIRTAVPNGIQITTFSFKKLTEEEKVFLQKQSQQAVAEYFKLLPAPSNSIHAMTHSLPGIGMWPNTTSVPSSQSDNSNAANNNNASSTTNFGYSNIEPD